MLLNRLRSCCSEDPGLKMLGDERRARIQMRTYMHIYIRARPHIYMHILHIRPCIHSYIHACIHAHVHIYYICVHVYIHTYMYIYTPKHTFIHTCIYTQANATFLHTCIHTRPHIFIHTYTLFTHVYTHKSNITIGRLTFILVLETNIKPSPRSAYGCQGS